MSNLHCYPFLTAMLKKYDGFIHVFPSQIYLLLIAVFNMLLENLWKSLIIMNHLNYVDSPFNEERIIFLKPVFWWGCIPSVSMKMTRILQASWECAIFFPRNQVIVLFFSVSIVASGSTFNRALSVFASAFLHSALSSLIRKGAMEIKRKGACGLTLFPEKMGYPCNVN